jgi:hypothetical protein
VAVDFEVLGKNPAAKISMLKETPRDRISSSAELLLISVTHGNESELFESR